MTMSPSMNREKLLAILQRDEGPGPIVNGKHQVYFDCCGKQAGVCKCLKPGHATIGWGHLLAKGIPRKVADVLLDADVDEAYTELLIRYPWVEVLSVERQAVLISMMFNLGPNRLNGFRKFLILATTDRYDEAAVEMLNSLWAEQVGDRALRLAEMWRTSKWV